MTAPLFRVPTLAEVGQQLLVTGPEGHHAVTVKRLRAGESVLLSDSRGHGVAGIVRSADQEGLLVEVLADLPSEDPRPYLVAVQALAKGDRDELAIAAMTEVGVAEVIPWQADRSIVQWASGPRGQRQHSKWVATVAEAAKQSRRLWVPPVQKPVTSASLARLIADEPHVLVLHEQATETLAGRVAELADPQRIMIVIGPEGGITPEEVQRFVAAGAHPVRIAPHVLRTSTAGVVALAQLAVTVPQ